ncbi:hypothetical protein ACLOJK_026037 [Asimina triloba]
MGEERIPGLGDASESAERLLGQTQEDFDQNIFPENAVFISGKGEEYMLCGLREERGHYYDDDGQRIRRVVIRKCELLGERTRVDWE